MYDKGKIIIGLVIFFLVVTLPILVSIGEDVNAPDLNNEQLIAEHEHCVEPAEYMRANHMQILDNWRHDVVRRNDRKYVSQAYGTEYDKSLSSGDKTSCMSCHDNKEQFCDSCHSYASVEPYCWTCHIEPKESI